MRCKLVCCVFLASVFVNFSCKDEENTPPLIPIDLNEASPCDSGLSIDDELPLNAAKAIEICETVQAKFIRANGSVAVHSDQIGILEIFGTINPMDGERMLMLATGRARALDQPDNCGSASCTGYGPGAAPVGFPQEISGCSPNPDINDDIGLQVTLTVPEGAKGFTFDHLFFTFDYPEFTCSAFNDQFIVTVDSKPAGSVNGNVVLDKNNNPMGVNNEFINPGRSSLLKGTGFDVWGDAATTGWLRTSVPAVAGEEITISFIIWDTGDSGSDSAVIIDNFKWTSDDTSLSTINI